MTPAQRRADFEQIAAAVSKQYAPYAWKIQAFGYDALRLKPWLERLAKVRDDLEYYELCMEYVASLRDLHSGYFLQSDFTAELPFYVDLYDGKALIEHVDRALAAGVCSIRSSRATSWSASMGSRRKSGSGTSPACNRSPTSAPRAAGRSNRSLSASSPCCRAPTRSATPPRWW